MLLIYYMVCYNLFRVILFALLCGYLPFEDKNTFVLYKKICAGQYRVTFIKLLGLFNYNIINII